jgi:MYXO-CTERM domain-containing protein
MKKTLLLVALLVASLSAFGQGVVNFNNRVTADVNGPLVDAPITDGEGGPRLQGNQGYRAALYGGPIGTAESSLVLLVNSTSGAGAVDFRTTAATYGYVNVGAEGARTVPGAPYGSQVVLQIRAWSGGFATYEAALSAQQGGDLSVKLGKSNLVTIGTTTGPTDQVIPRMVGLQGFAVVPVPEPSSIALGLLGLGALALIRRRK